MAWIEGPSVPIEWEGRQCWKWVDRCRTSWKDDPVIDVVPCNFSRHRDHCGGVWFMLLKIPENPHRRMADLGAAVHTKEQSDG